MYVTPKMHQLIHFPEQMLRLDDYIRRKLTISNVLIRFGPLRHTWCMRFEAKNKEIKGYVSNCTKNVPLI